MKALSSISPEKINIFYRAPALFVLSLLPSVLFNLWIRRYKDIVLVYQMGKVASSTVYATLRQEPDILALHFHRMPGRNMRELNARMGWKFRLRSIFHDMQGATGKRLLNRCPQKVRLVTLVRDPFSRNISGFFQNIWRHDIDTSDVVTAEMKARLTQMILTGYDHDVPLRWFDDEFLPSTSIDVFSLPFDSREKFFIGRNTPVPILIMRVELSDDSKLQVLNEFLSRDDLKLTQSNKGEAKYYSALYQELKKDFSYPDELVDRALQSKLMQHFFSEEERALLSARYRKTMPLNESARG